MEFAGVQKSLIVIRQACWHELLEQHEMPSVMSPRCMKQQCKRDIFPARIPLSMMMMKTAIISIKLCQIWGGLRKNGRSFTTQTNPVWPRKLFNACKATLNDLTQKMMIMCHLYIRSLANSPSPLFNGFIWQPKHFPYPFFRSLTGRKMSGKIGLQTVEFLVIFKHCEPI